MARGRKKKQDGGEGKEPADGHNNGGKPQALTDAERQALHFRHVGEYEGALASKKKSDADLKNCAKRIKAEGGSVRAVKLSISLKTDDGEKKLRAELAEMQEIATWNGVGIQVDMFSDERTPATDKAREAGRRAGMKGEPRKPPHDPSVPQYDAWLTGFAEGQSVLASEGFKRLTPVEQAAAAPEGAPASA